MDASQAFWALVFVGLYLLAHGSAFVIWKAPPFEDEDKTFYVTVTKTSRWPTRRELRPIKNYKLLVIPPVPEGPGSVSPRPIQYSRKEPN